jgi:hypothetical protein
MVEVGRQSQALLAPGWETAARSWLEVSPKNRGPLVLVLLQKLAPTAEAVARAKDQAVNRPPVSQVR